MKNNANKQQRKEILIVTAVSLAVLMFTLLITNINLTGFVVGNQNTIEKEIEIEVFADTHLEISNSNSLIKAILTLDDGTLLENQELELYKDSQLIVTDKTNSKGYIERNFDLPNTSPGTNSISGIFQGSPVQYLNPTETTHVIENEVSLENQKITFNSCTGFSEDVTWTGQYTQELEGSIGYYNWTPEYDCSAINETVCLIQNIETRTRIQTFNPYDSGYLGTGDVKISELSNCNNPLEGIYTEDLIQDSVKDGESKLDYYELGTLQTESVGKSKEIPCYGIQISASQYSIVDVVEIKYNLCVKGGTNEA